jgi:hypothetical protein
VSESNSADGKTSRPEKWSRELVELAALFLAIGASDLFANTLAHHRIRPLVLFGHGVLLIGCAALHRSWKHLPAAALAGPGVNIVSVQVHVLPRGAVEEFLVETPAEADLHDLVDVPTRVLTSAALAAATGGGLSRALRALPGECAIGWQEADEVHRGAGLEEGLEGWRSPVTIPRRRSPAPWSGSDLGITSLAVLSTGEVIPDPRHLEIAQREPGRLQRQRVGGGGHSGRLDRWPLGAWAVRLLWSGRAESFDRIRPVGRKHRPGSPSTLAETGFERTENEPRTVCQLSRRACRRRPRAS